MPEDLEAGNAYLQLMAGASGLQSDVDKKVRKVKAPDIVAKIDGQIGALEAKAAKARQVIAGIAKSAADPQIGLDIAELDAKAAVVRQRLDALGRQESTPKVQADIASAEAQLGRIESKLAALEYKRSTARVEADTAKAEADLRSIQGQITRLNGQRAQVQLDTSGAGRVLGELSAVDQKRSRVDGSNASVNIAASGGAQASGVLGAIVAGLAAVAAASPAAVGGLAGVLATGSALAQAGGAVTAGFSGIGDAIKSVAADEQTAATTSSSSAATRVNAANQIAGAQSALSAAVTAADRAAITGADQVADAARAEARAAVQADRARITSSQQVAAARRAQADAVVAAADRTAAAERSVGRAQESVTFAQESLTRARRDAAEANEDLQLSLSGIAISERRALLSQKKAKAALAKGSSDPLEQEELQLNVDEADQSLKEVRERYGDLQQEQAKFAKSGVEGSDQVTAATRSLRDSQLSAQDAVRSLAAAQRDGSRSVQDAAIASAQAQQQAAWTVQDAQAAQTDAAVAAGRAARDAGWAQQDAAKGVADAQRGLQQALAATAQGAGAAGAAGKKSAYDLAKLTPAGRDYVAFWTGTWKPAMEDVSNSVAGVFLPRVMTAQSQLLGLQPTFKKGLTDSGVVLGDLAVKGSNLATSPAFRASFATIMDSNNRSLRSWGEAGLYGVDAARSLTVAGLPLSEQLARTAAAGMRGVDSFLLQKEASGELAGFMQLAGDKVEQLWHLLVELAGAGYQVAVAVAPVGSVVIDLVTGIASLVGEFAQANPGMIQFAAASGIGLAAVNALAKGAVALKASAALSMTGISTLSGILTTGLNPRALYATTAMRNLGSGFTAAGSMAGAFVGNVTRSSTAASVTDKAVRGAGTAVRGLGSALPLVGAALVAGAAGMDAMGTSTDEATAALSKGGAAAAAMRAELAATDAKTGETGVTVGNFGNYLTGSIMKLLGFESSTKSATAALEQQRAGMSNLERAQSLATESQGNYEAAVRQFGAASPQAVAALGDLNGKTRDVEIAQVAVREKTDLATAAVLYQRDTILAGLDANLRARMAAQQLAKDQDALAQAIGRYGAGSQQAKDAGLQLEQSQLRQAEAAKSSAGGQNAYVQSIRDMVAATKGDLTPTLAGMVQSLDRAGLAAAGAKVQVDGAGRAVAVFPGGKTVVLDANVSPAMAGLDGVMLKLGAVPAGKTVNVGVIDLPAQQALQAIGFTVTTLPNGQVTVTAHDEQARATLLAFQWYADAVRTNPAIAANPQLAYDTMAGFINRANASVGVPGLSSNPGEANRIVKDRLDTYNRSWSTLPVNAWTKPADDAARAAHDAASRPVTIPVGADYQFAQRASEGWWAAQWRQINEFGNSLSNWLMGKGFRPNSQGGLALAADGGLIGARMALATGGRVRQFPTGGRVRGPGTATSDSIPSLLSDGEYVIRAAAVRKVGVPALDAINGMRDGGPVLPLHFATGGAAVDPATSAAPAAVPAVPAATGSTDAMAGSLDATTAAASALTPALAQLAAVQTGLLVPAQAAVVAGQQALVGSVLGMLLPTLALADQQIGVQSPLAHQALQLAQGQTRLDTDATALNTSVNSTWMGAAITAMSLAAQVQHAGLRAGQLATRLDTDATMLNTQLNNQAMTLSTQGMSLQAQFQHQLLRAGQLLTQQNTTLTAQNTAANNANMIATTQGMSAQNQVHLANLRVAQGVTTAATTAFANAWQAQLARTIPDSGNPIKWVINFPMRSIVDAWNNLDGQFALGKHVNPAVPNFAVGGSVRGPGTATSDSIPARLSDGEYVVRASIAERTRPFLDAFNAGQPEAINAAGGFGANPRGVAGKFSRGGPVATNGRVPGYAAGGPIEARIAAAKKFAASMAGKPYIWGGTGPGGMDCCIIGPVRVYGRHGAKPISEIETGDEVYSYVDGKLVLNAVTASWKSKTQPVFKVRTRNRAVTASTNHPFLRLVEVEPSHHVKGGRRGEQTKARYDVEWARLDELRRGDLLVQPRYMTPEPSADAALPDGTSVTADVAWLIGALLGDGTVFDRRVALCLFDEKRNRAAQIIERTWGGTASYSPKHGIQISHKAMASALAEFGLTERGSEKRVPVDVWQWPAEQQRAFLDGYCDADGHRPADSSRHGQRTLHSASSELIEDVRALHIMLGDAVSNVSTNRRNRPIVIKGKTVQNALPLHSFTVWNGGKGEAALRSNHPGVAAWLDAGDFTVGRILEISDQGVQDTYDLTVEGAHNFIADGVVVHNSGMVGAVTHVLRGESAFAGRLGVARSQPWAGFRPGLSGAWATGYNATHTAGTLAGTNIESSKTPIIYPGAHGADSPQFSGHAFLPTIGGAFVSGGAGGGPSIDVDAVVNAAFAKTYRELADVPKFFGPSAQVGRDQGTAKVAADKVRGVAVNKLTEMFATAGNGAMGTGPVADQVRAVANTYGWGGGAQWAALDWLIGHESSWNPRAQNPSSTAYGLFQFLNSTWGAMGGTKTDNPSQQARLGLKYIKQRYRDPLGAKAFWSSHHWYANGGVVPGTGNRDTVPAVLTPGERVLTPVQAGQYDTLGQLVGRNGIRVDGLDQAVGGGSAPLVGKVENNYYGDQRGGDMRDLAHTLRRVRVASGS